MKTLIALFLTVQFVIVSSIAYAELIEPSAVNDYYCNERFDFCVNVPDDLKWHDESTNGDGRHFTLVNSDAEILVFGNLEAMIWEMTDEEFLTREQKYYHDKYDVSYERLTKHTYTVSGYTPDDEIFYHVIKANKGITAHLYLNYPKIDRNRMKLIVEQMAGSFQLEENRQP